MQSPWRLGLALEEIRRSVVAELLDTLATVTPAFFETLVLDLLHRMGYGALLETGPDRHLNRGLRQDGAP